MIQGWPDLRWWLSPACVGIDRFLPKVGQFCHHFPTLPTSAQTIFISSAHQPPASRILSPGLRMSLASSLDPPGMIFGSSAVPTHDVLSVLRVRDGEGGKRSVPLSLTIQACASTDEPTQSTRIRRLLTLPIPSVNVRPPAPGQDVT
jgi:hypothetical protein